MYITSDKIERKIEHNNSKSGEMKSFETSTFSYLELKPFYELAIVNEIILEERSAKRYNFWSARTTIGNFMTLIHL